MKNKPVKPKKKSLKRRVIARWQLYLWLLIPVIYFLIFYYYPMFGIQLAFKRYDPALGIWGSKWNDFQNFKRFFGAYFFERTLTNTLRVSLYSILAGFPIPIIFALMLNSMRGHRYKKFVQMVTYIPHFISTVLIVGMLNQFLNPVNGIYGMIYAHITGDYIAPDLLGKADAFSHLYVWSGVWQEMGWDSIIYIAALAGVDAELHEAARIDGASRFKRILYIDIPSLIPTIVTLLILRCGAVMSVGFEKAYLMQNNMNVSKSEVIATYAYKTAFSMGGVSDFGLSTAIGLFNNAVNLVLLVTVNYISSRVSENSLW